MKFAILIKKARLELGLTMEDVAKDTGVSRESISYYEHDKFLPGLEAALKLCKYLGVSLDDLKQDVLIPADFPRPKLVRSEQTH